jgi:hypothetical protein
MRIGLAIDAFLRLNCCLTTRNNGCECKAWPAGGCMEPDKGDIDPTSGFHPNATGFQSDRKLDGPRSEQAVELFVRLHRWCEQYKPDLLRRLWGAKQATVPFLAGLFVFLCSVIAMVTGSVSIKDPWREEVNTLIAKGVKTEDHGRALELLLRKLADLPADRQMFYPPTWFLVTAATAAVVALMLSFGARTAFDIGKGMASVRRQKRYLRFLQKSVPTFLILGVLASMLGSFAFDFLRSK